MIGSVNRKMLRNILKTPAHLKILLVIAIGKPREGIVIEAVGPNNDIRYWRDDNGIHHVPKRDLEVIVIDTYA